MLKKSDESVLKVINDNAFKEESCLISKESIVAFVGNEKLVNSNNVEEILNRLCASDYIDLLLSSKKDENFIALRYLSVAKILKKRRKRNLTI